MVRIPIGNEKSSTAVTPGDRMLFTLRAELRPLFAVLDAARDPTVLKLLVESKEEYQSLYEGLEGGVLAHFAPYLVRLPLQSPLLEALVHQGWGKSWGIYLTCDKPLREIRRHFRHFLLVKTEDGQDVYFRFYDPRVLRVYLPTCTTEETNQFFGPVSCYLMESDQPKELLKFIHSQQGATREALRLDAPERGRTQSPLP